MKLFSVLITGVVAIFYAIMWYMNESIPAWHALVWVLCSFINELEKYLDPLYDIKKNF